MDSDGEANVKSDLSGDLLRCGSCSKVFNNIADFATHKSDDCVFEVINTSENNENEDDASMSDTVTEISESIKSLSFVSSNAEKSKESKIKDLETKLLEASGYTEVIQESRALVALLRDEKRRLNSSMKVAKSCLKMLRVALTKTKSMKNVLMARRRYKKKFSFIRSGILDSRSEEMTPPTVNKLIREQSLQASGVPTEETFFCESDAYRHQDLPSANAYLEKSMLNTSSPISINDLLVHTMHDLRMQRAIQHLRSECPSGIPQVNSNKPIMFISTESSFTLPTAYNFSLPQLNPIHPEPRNLPICTPYELPSPTAMRNAHLLPSTIPSVHPSDCPANLSTSACSSSSSTSRRTHRGRPCNSRVSRGGFPQ